MCCSNGTVKLDSVEKPPELIVSLLQNRNKDSKDFLEKICRYNGAFQMTSFGATEIVFNNFTTTFKVRGQVYHRIGSLLPIDHTNPKFLQLYFMGQTEEIESNIRVKHQGNIITNNIIIELQRIFHTINPYIQKFKTAIESACTSEDNYTIVIDANKVPIGEHRGRYNIPVGNEVAGIVVDQQHGKRDIILKLRDEKLQRVSETHKSYDALQYPLIFIRGEDGYSIDVFKYNPITKEHETRKTVSAMQFYSYRLMIRSESFNLLHYFRELINMYWVDMWIKIESERLLYLKNNQTKLRVDEYIHLKDAVENDGNVEDVGQLFILPSSFVGGPRYMHEKTQDALTYVRHYGCPNLFITFTCNPKWPEITKELWFGQKSQDRHDVIARVFRQKVQTLMGLINVQHIFGKTICYMYTVEWQKRGLPHIHILIWLQNKIRPDQIDSVIRAELPDKNLDPILFNIVTNLMVHGPCGVLNPSSPCMGTDKKCTKRYPKKFVQETMIGDDGYPQYRRRSPNNGGFCENIIRNSVTLTVDNSIIVPYCPLLSKALNAHINVEYCNSVKSIKYVTKYINKGSDQAVFATVNDKDEIGQYQIGRYVSTNEAVWKILGFPIHERYPTVMHLAVHLENGQRVYYNSNSIQYRLERIKETTLTSFFRLCEQDNFAQTLYYYQVPTYYTYNKISKCFKRRVYGKPVPGSPDLKASDSIGRIYTIHPNNTECYFLRLLLHHIKGPTSFSSLRTINGVIHSNFQSACKALGLVEDDGHYNNTLQEASISDMPSKLRELFVIMLIHCQLTDPLQLWINHRNSFAEDVLYEARLIDPQVDFNDAIYNKTLMLIEDKLLTVNGKNLNYYQLPCPQRNQMNTNYLNQLVYERESTCRTEEVNENNVLTMEDLLTSDQKIVYNTILDSIQSQTGGFFFLDAPGGTGKTFILNLVISKLQILKKVVVAVASSGIAATLLKGGRTAHSTFKLPLNLIHTETPVCNIKRGSAIAKVLSECDLIIWDECTMSHKKAIEAVNISMQDIRKNNKLMGGTTIVFSGDFRQILPVIPRGTKADEINACLKSSNLWSFIHKLQLTTNMRTYLDKNYKAQTFPQTLLKIGNGELKHKDNGQVCFPDEFGHFEKNIENFINKVYPDVEKCLEKDLNWWCERAILASTNNIVSNINNYLLNRVQTFQMEYNSIDTTPDPQQIVNFPVEFLHSLNPPGLPAHNLKLKIGTPIMLIRNLNPPVLCNGTRLLVDELLPNVIKAVILNGKSRGEYAYIPRIPMIPSDYPFEFKRLQFPVKPCFAITINKSQGQTFKYVGVDLTEPCFSHGQLYVACSRIGNPNNLYILLSNTNIVSNIVYREVL